MDAIAARMTVDEYYALPVEGDRRTQLVGGQIVVDEPRPLHGVLQARITAALQSWIDDAPRRGLVILPTDVVMTQHDVYGPDISWVAQRHVPDDLTKRLSRVPDLCVEVRSPSTWRYDVGRKKSVYEAGGLPELWLVDYKTVLVYRRSVPEGSGFDIALELTHGDRLASPQLPGFELDLARLFRP
jgi:Uma2 family endonuclease